MGDLKFSEQVFIGINGAALFWSVFSNVCIVTIVITHKKMRTPTNILICNLAISDTLFGGIVLPQNLHDISHTGEYHEGPVACRLVNFLPVLLIITSIYTIVTMSYDRYRAVVKATSVQLQKSQTYKVIAVIWFGSTLCTMPSIIEYSMYTAEINETVLFHPTGFKNISNSIASTTHMLAISQSAQNDSTAGSDLHISGNADLKELTTGSSDLFTTGSGDLQTMIITKQVFRCGSEKTPWSFTMFNGILLLVVGYLLPIVIICVNYGKVIQYIINYTKNIKNTNQDPNNFVMFKKKVKIVKMLVIVAALFVVCWLPYFTILIYAKSTKQDSSESLAGWVNLFRIALSTFSVSYNAILYITCNQQFYNGFKELLTCSLCCKGNQVGHRSVDSPQRRTLGISRNTNKIGDASSSSEPKKKNDVSQVNGHTNQAFQNDG